MRCFLAVDLTSENRAKIGQIVRNFDADGMKKVEEENLHITLKFLGEVPEEILKEYIDKLKGVKFDAFTLNLREIGVFPNSNYPKVIWIGIDPTDRLKALVDKINGALGAPLESYVPHVTLSRVKHKPAEETLKWLSDNENVEIGEQVVDGFVVKKSVLGPDGPRYEDVAVFCVD